MREITQFENHAVEIWRRPRQRHIHLRVRPDGGLRVTCAVSVPRREIFAFIRESENFIQEGLRRIREHAVRYPPKQIHSGETFLFMGQRVLLDIIWSWNTRIKVELREGVLEMIAPIHSTEAERRVALFKFFQRQGRTWLTSLVRVYAKRMGLSPRSLSIRGQKTRWGSCSALGDINLNWKLIAAPLEVMEYVVVHELAHMEHLNHSPEFWQVVGAYFPHYRQTRKSLRGLEAEISVQFKKK